MKSRKTKRVSAIVSMILVISMMCSGSVLAKGENKIDRVRKAKSIETPSPSEFSMKPGEKNSNSLISPLAFTPTSSEVEPNKTMGTADQITLSSGRNAVISSAGDVDWYLFRPATSGKYRFDMSDIPVQCDYDMTLYNGANTVLTRSNSANRYETIIINLSANTPYYLRVFSYSGTSTAKYNVTVTNDACALLNWSYPFRGNTPPKNVSSNYGSRVLNGQTVNHFGVDIGQSSGVGIFSATYGTCFATGAELKKDPSQRGYFVSIKASSSYAPTTNYITTYMHMRSPTPVTKNAAVTTETLLGYVGTTGYSFGEHLHFQVNTNGTNSGSNYSNTLNPLRFFPQINFVNPSYKEMSIKSTAQSAGFNEKSETPFGYYMLDSSLIDLVGIKRFEKWANETDDESRNVPGFLKYFKISNKRYTQTLNK